MGYRPKTLNRWKLPECYAGASWPNYYVFLSRHRDSDALDRANFDAGLKAIGGEQTNDEDLELVKVIRESHWAVGWIEWIAIHRTAYIALSIADKIAARLQDYPIISEDLLSEYETDDANETWKNCYNWRDRVEYIREHRRQFEFHDFAEMLNNVRGNYFSGYASELIS